MDQLNQLGLSIRCPLSCLTQWIVPPARQEPEMIVKGVTSTAFALNDLNVEWFESYKWLRDLSKGNIPSAWHGQLVKVDWCARIDTCPACQFYLFWCILKRARVGHGWSPWKHSSLTSFIPGEWDLLRRWLLSSSVALCCSPSFPSPCFYLFFLFIQWYWAFFSALHSWTWLWDARLQQPRCISWHNTGKNIEAYQICGDMWKILICIDTYISSCFYGL